MDTDFVHENNENRKKHLQIRQLENNTLNDNNEEAFSWLLEFNKSACLSAGNRNYQHLKQLLLLYTQNILSSVETSNVKFNDETNLKNNINNVLIFFHLYWLDIKQNLYIEEQENNAVACFFMMLKKSIIFNRLHNAKSHI